MSGVNFERAKIAQGYLQQLQRPACSNCQLRLVHQMQCGRGGFYVQHFGLCASYESGDQTLRTLADYELKGKAA